MTNRKLNTLLVEAFGDLEQACNQIYNDTHGVTAYINEMKDLETQGIPKVKDWSISHKRLKEIRHKRNKLSHGEISFREKLTNKEDVAFLLDFRKKVLNKTDPIAVYYRQRSGKKASKKTQKSKPFSGCLAGVLAALLTLAVIFGLIYAGIIG